MPRVDPSRGLQFDTLITALEMAALGHGFALGRTTLAADMFDSDRLVAPFEQSVPSDETFYVVTLEHQYMTPQAKAFLTWLLEEAGSARNAAAHHPSESRDALPLAPQAEPLELSSRQSQSITG